MEEFRVNDRWYHVYFESGEYLGIRIPYNPETWREMGYKMILIDEDESVDDTINNEND